MIKKLQIIFFTSLFGLVSPTANAVCNDNIPDRHQDTRYLISPGGTVKDLETGLTWDRCSLGLSGNDCSVGVAVLDDWATSLSNANNIGIHKGFSDWRMPNLKELRSLAAINCHTMSINEVVFPNTQGGYWSSTPSKVNSGGEAYFISFIQGFARTAIKRLDGEFSVRLVRSE